MQRALPFLALLIAMTAAGADVKLGPEQPIVPRVAIAPAAYEQLFPSVASNGRDYVAVWADWREQFVDLVSGWTPTGPRAATFDVSPRIYSSRLGGDGSSAEPLGDGLANELWYFPQDPLAFRNPLIASNGEAYLVVYQTLRDPRAHAQRLDENGRPAGAERSWPGGAPVSFASNGSTYLLLDHTGKAISLDADGVELGEATLGFSDATVSAAAGRYTVVQHRCSTCRVVTIDDRSGSLEVTATTVTVPGKRSGARSYAELAIDDRLLFASADGQQTELTILDRAGHVLKPPTALNLPVAESLQIFWDGSELLLAGFNGQTLSAILVPAGGFLPAEEPYVLSRSAAPPIAFASNGETRVLTWTDARGNVVSRAVARFNELAMPLEAKPIAYSGSAQNNVQIAVDARAFAAVWRDDERSSIHAAINGREQIIARTDSRVFGNPSVTFGADSLLVAWYEQDRSTSEARLLARRYTFDGNPLDDAPLVVVPELKKRYLTQRPAVTADGGAFVIADDSIAGTVRLLRLQGPVLSELSSDRCCIEVGNVLRPHKTASDWIVPTTYYRFTGGPAFSDFWGLALTHLPPPGGASMDLLGLPDRADIESAITYSDTRAAAVLQSIQKLVLVQKSLLADWPSIQIEVPAGPFWRADVAWDGSEYVVAWTTRYGGPIQAMRFDEGGHALDAAPFDIAPSGSTASAPSVAATESGVIIAYSRSAAEAGGAPRAFTRTLARLPLFPRRYSVRH